MAKSYARPRVVVIGGGFGGLMVARKLKSANVDITLVDRENHHLFQPLLYQVATAALSPEQIAVPIRSILHARPHNRVFLDEARHVDMQARRVFLGSGSELAYDYLVLAAGARTTFLGHTTWTRHARGLKSLRDALGIREQILECFERANRESNARRRHELLSFVVVGGGPLGVELAGAISELGRRVLARDYSNVRSEEVKVKLVEMADRLLPAGFDPALSERAADQLRDLNVEVLTSTRVEDVHSDAVVTDKGVLRTSLVCWAPGVEPVELAQDLESEHVKGGRVRVAQDCSLPEQPNVFAIGDMAGFIPAGEEAPLPALAPVAMQQARFVAAAIRKDLANKPRGEFHYRDKGMLATVGRSRAVAQLGKLKLHGSIAWLAWLAVHLYFLIGFRNRLIVLIDWFWSYLGFGRGARLMTGDPERRSHTQRPERLQQQPAASTAGNG